MNKCPKCVKGIIKKVVQNMEVEEACPTCQGRGKVTPPYRLDSDVVGYIESKQDSTCG